MAKSYISETNLDELFDFNKNKNQKINFKKHKFENKPSNLSIGLNVGHVGDCPSSSSKNSIQPNSVKSVKVKRVKSYLSKLIQKKKEAEAMKKFLKLNRNALMEDSREMFFKQMYSYGNTKFKKELSESSEFQNENKLNKHIQQQNNRIEALSKLNLTLGKTIEIKNSSFRQLTEKYNELDAKYQNTLSKNKLLAKNKRDIKKLVVQCEIELNNLSENYKVQLEQMSEKEKIQNKRIEELEEKLVKIEAVKNKEIGKLKTDNQQLHVKLKEYEECASICKQIEEKCKRKCEIAKANEEYFIKQRKDFEQVIEELTNVVNQNKLTLLELSEMNKFQENLLKNQTGQLLTRQKDLDLAVSEIEMLRKLSRELQIEIESLKPISEESLKNKETCQCLMQEVDTLKATLAKEKMKEKLIEEKSETIICIKNELEHKTNELNNIKHEMSKTENETDRIKSELESKRQELQKELFEKEMLNMKIMKLESEKNNITIEMENLQELLETYNVSANLNVEPKLTVSELNIYNEKNKAMSVATFATQKLLETVTDYQLEIDKQKRREYILADLLRSKDEALNLVKSQITSLCEITHVALGDLIQDSTNKVNLNSCTPSTMTTQYESCESTRTTQKQENGDLAEILMLLKD